MVMKLDDLKKHVGFGVIAAKLAHVLSKIPRALGFVEDHEVMRRRSVSVFVSVCFGEDVNILDERFGLDARLYGWNSIAHSLLSEELLQNLHEWPIPAHEVDGVDSIFAEMGKAKANKSFSRAREAGGEGDDEFASCLCSLVWSTA